MTRTEIISLLVLALMAGAGVPGCDEAKSPNVIFIDHKYVDIKLDEGQWVSDDFYITNNSPYGFFDLDLSLELTGANAEKKTLRQHWSEWKRGETKHVVAKIAQGETVPNIQTLTLSGSGIPSDTDAPLAKYVIDVMEVYAK